MLAVGLTIADRIDRPSFFRLELLALAYSFDYNDLLDAIVEIENDVTKLGRVIN